MLFFPNPRAQIDDAMSHLSIAAERKMIIVLLCLNGSRDFGDRKIVLGEKGAIRFFFLSFLSQPRPLPILSLFSLPNTADAETAEQLLERASSSGSSKEPRIDGRAFRRSLTKTGRYVRNPANDAESLALMEEHGVGYSSTGLVAQMRKPENGNTWKQGNLTVTLAQAYGK